MKKHLGGLAKFLNDETQNAAASQAGEAEKIVYIDIDEIEPNPNNFYGLRDIESLAGLIAVSHMVEPLMVCPKEDGKYLLISGHRRRAAVQKLLEDGGYDERKLPCIVRQRRKISIPQENGESIVFDESEVDMLHLIASNRGQRKERTMDEKLSEVKFLEPFARAIFAQRKQEQGKGMVFRKFFAEEILDISSSKLQRIESIGKMSESVKLAVQDGIISETAATMLAGLSLDEQDAVLIWLVDNQRKGTVQDVSDAVAAIRTSGSDGESESEENVDDTAEDDTVNPAGDGGEADAAVESGVSEASFTEETFPESPEPETSPAGSDNQPPSVLPPSSAVPTERASQLRDVPDSFDNPQEEAEDWFREERLAFYRAVYEQAQKLSESEPDERKAAQWGIRASVARYHIAELSDGR